jgi:hypothetical protein
MEHVTLEQVNKNVLALKAVVERIREIIGERGLELADDVALEIEESRKRSKEEFISHEDMKKEFD